MKRMLILALTVAMLAACASAESALTVNETEISCGMANAWMWLVKEKLSDITDYYERTLGIDYWSLTYPNGQTVWDNVKADAFKQLVMMSVFADIARDEGLGLSPEEAAKCADTAQRLTGQRDFTPEDMEQVLIMRMLSSKAYNYELSLQDIDEEAVIGAIDASAYIAYEVDYLYVPFYIFSGSDEKREECCSELNGMRDFSGDYAEAARYRSGFQAGCLTLCPSLGDSDPILLRAAQALQVGEVSDVIITDYGLFMLRLKDDSDTSLYEAAVDDALLSARKSAYQTEFNRLFASAEYTLNALYWDTLQP